MKRRSFIQATAATTSFTILPSGLWGNSPNGKLRSVHIGVGGKGKTDTENTAEHPNVEVAGLCDVDAKFLAASHKIYPKAETFRDYRELFAKMGDSIDLVTVSTPDHTHAPAAMMAMNLGKAVYCQKPLTHDIFESRALMKKAAASGVATQMGIQNQSTREYRIAQQLLQSGTIGKIKRVHSWSFKTWGYDGPDFAEADNVPEHLDWDLWLGTAADRPYKDGAYHPKNWRRMLDFGCGTLGDMGIHILDPPMLSLDLDVPRAVKTTCRQPTQVGHPVQNFVEFEFAKTRFTSGALKLFWTDGSAPADHEDLRLPDGWSLPKQGSMFIGENGRMMLPHVGAPRLFPEENFKTIKYPKFDRMDHYAQWIDHHLGKSGSACRADFAYASKLTETVLLGVIGNRFPGMRLNWDAAAMRFSNVPAADSLIRRSYRKGFDVEGLI